MSATKRMQKHRVFIWIIYADSHSKTSLYLNFDYLEECYFTAVFQLQALYTFSLPSVFRPDDKNLLTSPNGWGGKKQIYLLLALYKQTV